MGQCSSNEIGIEPPRDIETASLDNESFDQGSTGADEEPLFFQEWRDLIQELTNNNILNKYILSRGRENFKNVSELKSFLLKSPAKTDVECVWAIFLWITHNIDYDFDGLRNGVYSDQNSDSVFKTGLSVCAGYSNLFETLCSNFKIQSITVNGYAKGYGYEVGKKLGDMDHEWNLVNINNKWQFIESTWGAGYGNDKEGFVRRFQPYYFFTPPELFIYEHYPEKNEHQLLPKSLTLKQFELLPYYKLEFFINGFKCLSHFNSIIEPKTNPFEMEFEAPDDVNLIGNIVMRNGNEIKDSTFIQRDLKTNNYLVDVYVPTTKKCKISLFGGPKGNKTYSWISDFVIQPSNSMPTTSDIFCKKYSFPNRIFLFEPKQRHLKLNTNYLFSLYVKANDVVLVNDDQNLTHFQPKTSKQNAWIINYKPEVEGKLILSVKINNGNKYTHAFEYQVIK